MDSESIFRCCVWVACLSVGLSCSETTVGLGSIASIELHPPELVFDALGALDKIQALVKDENGKLVPGAKVEWTIRDTKIVAFESGNVVRSIAEGETILSAKVLGSPVAAQAVARVHPVPAALYFTVPPRDIVVGKAFDPPVQVQVVDRLGYPTGSAPGVVELTVSRPTEPEGEQDGSGELQGEATREIVEGEATFSDLTLHRSGTGMRLVALHPDFPPLVSAPFDAEPGPAAAVVFSSERVEASWGERFDLGATLRDEFGNQAQAKGLSFELSLESRADSSLQGKRESQAMGTSLVWKGISLEAQPEGETEGGRCFDGISYRLVAAEKGGEIRGSIQLDLRIPFVSLAGSYCAMNRIGRFYCWGSPYPWFDVEISEFERLFSSPAEMPHREKLQILGQEGFCFSEQGGQEVFCSPNWSGEGAFTIDLGPGETVKEITRECALTHSNRLLCWVYWRHEPGSAQTYDYEILVPSESPIQRLYPEDRSALTEAGGLFQWKAGGVGSTAQLVEEDLIDRSAFCKLGSSKGSRHWVRCTHADWNGWRDFETPAGERFLRVIGSCLLAESGSVYCVGARPGNRTSMSDEFVPLVHPAGGRFVDGHATMSSICLLDDVGVIYCWGDSDLGQGIETERSLVPLPIDCDGFREESP